MEVDIFGQLWAVDKDAGRITKYTYDLFPLCTYGSSGTGDNQFWQPMSISTHSGYLGSGDIYVMETWTDSSGGQYFGIGTDIVDFSLSSTGDEQLHYINYVLVDPSIVSVKIYNQQGGLVKTLFESTQLSGACSFVWGGADNSGQQSATGEYRVVVVDTSTYGNIDDQTPVNVVTREIWFHHNLSCCQARGNVDGIIGVGGPVDVNDLTYLVAFLFQGSPSPPCTEEGNVDGVTGVGGPIDVGDMSYLVAFLFQGGPPPPACP